MVAGQVQRNIKNAVQRLLLALLIAFLISLWLQTSSNLPMSFTTAKASAIAAEFDFSTEQLIAAVKQFEVLALKGLSTDDQPMTMIPSYVTDVPTGKETGTYLALDLGGTNLRVCSIL